MKNIDFNTKFKVKNIDRELVSKKLDNLKDLQFLVNSEIVNKQLLIWRDKDPNNEKLKEFRDAILQIELYVNELQNDRHLLMLSIDEYRSDKIRAVERARRSEETKKD
jgi:hypothetical protein